MTQKKTRAVIYARRSQEKQETSVEVQIEEATRYIKGKGWQLVGVYPDDEQNTGRKEFKKRKQFLRLMEDAPDHTFDIVVTRDPSRLGGDTSRTMRAIEDLTDDGIAVWYYYTDQQVKLGTWVEKATFAMVNAASEGERDAISGRTYEALTVRARQGFNAGGACYGYTNVWIVGEDRKRRTAYEINEGQAAIVREIFEKRAEGIGLRTLTKDLNRRGVPSPRLGKRGTGSWSHGCIREMLRRERYIGVITYGLAKKTYRKGTKVREVRPPEEVTRSDAPHLRIVPQELWEAVQATFTADPKRPLDGKKGRKPAHLLSTLGRCSECGGPIHAKNGKQGKQPIKVYVCGYYQDRASCKNSLRRPVDEVDSALIDGIKVVLREEVVLEILAEMRREISARTKDTSGEIPALEKQASDLKREIGNLAEAIALTEGSVGALASKLSQRQERLGDIDARLKLLKAAPSVLTLEVRRLEAKARARIKELREFLGRDVGESRKVISSLLDGPLKFTPITTAEGRRYKVEGRIATGDLLTALSVNVASPAGSAHCGYAETTWIPLSCVA